MAFFDPPPAPDPPRRGYQRSPWSGPAENVIPITVPLDLMLGLTEDTAVVVTEASGYPDGVLLNISTVLRPGTEPDPRLHQMHDPDGLRFGVLFADGRKATTTRRGRPPEPDEPVLTQRGGHGGQLSYRTSYWLWPLPPDGPCAFVCEWPARSLPESRAEVNGSVFREAALRATELWPLPADEPGGPHIRTGTSSSWSTSTMFARRADQE